MDWKHKWMTKISSENNTSSKQGLSPQEEVQTAVCFKLILCTDVLLNHLSPERPPVRFPVTGHMEDRREVAACWMVRIHMWFVLGTWRSDELLQVSSIWRHLGETGRNPPLLNSTSSINSSKSLLAPLFVLIALLLAPLQPPPHSQVFYLSKYIVARSDFAFSTPTIHWFFSGIDLQCSVCTSPCAPPCFREGVYACARTSVGACVCYCSGWANGFLCFWPVLVSLRFCSQALMLECKPWESL